MSNGINVHLNPSEVRLINLLVSKTMKYNPEIKKSWEGNKTASKLIKRLDKANTNAEKFFNYSQAT